MLWHALGEGVARKIMGVGQMIDPGQQGAEEFAVIDDATDRDSAEADPVIAALAPDQAGAGAFAAHPVIGDGDFQRGIHRLRPGIAEKDAVQIVRQHVLQAGRQLECRRVAHLERGRIIHLGHLGLDRLDDLRATVTGIDAPQARRTVQHLPPLRRRVPHILGADEQARIGLELPVGGKRHPERAKIVNAAGSCPFRFVWHRASSNLGRHSCKSLAQGHRPPHGLLCATNPLKRRGHLPHR